MLGRSGAIVAILFAYPLEAPAPVDHNNKILWVSRLPYTWPATLRISAQRMNGTRPCSASRCNAASSGAPGPSIMNLPTPGCPFGGFRSAGRIMQIASICNTDRGAKTKLHSERAGERRVMALRERNGSLAEPMSRA